MFTADQLQIIERLELSENQLSRTRKGHADTTASTTKSPLLLSGEQLAQKTALNTKALHRLLFELRERPAPNSVSEVQRSLRQIEDTVNEGLLPGGRYREWELSYADDSAEFSKKALAKDVPQAMDRFTRELFVRWSQLPSAAVVTAAWAEWMIQGPIHPYYDGCGRISRAVSAWILLWSGQTVPVYSSRQDWFRHAMSSREDFTLYFKKCLAQAKLEGGTEPS